MLIIKNKQLEVFNSFFFNKFINDLHDYLLDEFSEETSHLSNIELKKSIISAIDMAEKYDIQSESDIWDFVLLYFRRNELREYAISKELLEILSYPDRPAERKLILMEEYFYKLDHNNNLNYDTNNESETDFDTIV